MTAKDEKISVRVDPELQALIPNYLENRHKDIQTMRQALEQGDYETIRVQGHSMKGSGGGYGFDAITDVGQSVENAAKNRNVEEIKKGLEALSDYLDRLEVIYE